MRLPKSDAHSALAAVAPSAARRLVALLSSLQDVARRVLIPGFHRVRAPSEAELRASAGESDRTEHDVREALGIDESIDGLTALFERPLPAVA